jgi:hypothetical protein
LKPVINKSEDDYANTSKKKLAAGYYFRVIIINGVPVLAVGFKIR